MVHLYETKPIYVTGHGAFSENNHVNDIVGLILHSSLLTPYHSWKITHRKHHSNTASCEHDEAFVPFTENEIKALLVDIANDSPLFNLLKVIFFLLLGWMPTYLGHKFFLYLIIGSINLDFNFRFSF